MQPEASTSPNQRPPEAEKPYSATGRWHALLYGILLILFGCGLHLTTVALPAFSRLAGLGRLIPGDPNGQFHHPTLGYDGLPVCVGCGLSACGFFVLLPAPPRHPCAQSAY